MASAGTSNIRPQPDRLLTDIADYVLGYEITSALAFETARHCLIDALGCALAALDYPACQKLGTRRAGNGRGEWRQGAGHAV